MTRWSSWLKSALFFADNFHNVKKIVLAMKDEGIIVNKAKEIVVSPNIFLFGLY